MWQPITPAVRQFVRKLLTVFSTPYSLVILMFILITYTFLKFYNILPSTVSFSINMLYSCWICHMLEEEALLKHSNIMKYIYLEVCIHKILSNPMYRTGFRFHQIAKAAKLTSTCIFTIPLYFDLHVFRFEPTPLYQLLPCLVHSIMVTELWYFYIFKPRSSCILVL